MSDLSHDQFTAFLDTVISKVCHDIISPIGAIHNGLEILEEIGPDAGPDVIQLVAYSAQQASAKLQAFRLAYGAGGNDGGLKPEEAHKTVEAIISADGKITQEWNPNDQAWFNDDRPEGFCKVLTCVLLLAIESLPKGGALSVSTPENNAFQVSARGDGAFIREISDAALNGRTPMESTDAHAVHAAMTALNCKRFGYRLTLEQTEDTCILFSLVKA